MQDTLYLICAANNHTTFLSLRQTWLTLKLQTGNNIEEKNLVETFQASFTDNFRLPVLISRLSTVWKLTKTIHAQQ